MVAEKISKLTGRFGDREVRKTKNFLCNADSDDDVVILLFWNRIRRRNGPRRELFSRGDESILEFQHRYSG